MWSVLSSVLVWKKSTSFSIDIFLARPSPPCLLFSLIQMFFCVRPTELDRSGPILIYRVRLLQPLSNNGLRMGSWFFVRVTHRALGRWYPYLRPTNWLQCESLLSRPYMEYLTLCSLLLPTLDLWNVPQDESPLLGTLRVALQGKSHP